MKLNKRQAEFKFKKNNFKFCAYVAGFGSGKTYIGSICLCEQAGLTPKVRQGFFAPTYRDIRDVFYPTLEEVAEGMGYRIAIRKGDHEVDLYRGRKYYGTIICRSMDDPANIVGFKIGQALVDELDVLKESKARQAWNKIIARMRWNQEHVRNNIMVTTTPEGFRFVYQKFAKNPTPSYGMVQASTYDNEKFLPEGYIDGIKESYDENLIEAYLNGQFVNLTQGPVYPAFNRVKNTSFQTVRPKDVLHIGMDFNVRKMSAVVHIERNGAWHAVDEFYKVLDTPAMIREIKARYPEHQIKIYPDSSGKNTSSKDADVSDHSLLRDAGFQVIVDSQNPRIRARINAMNSAFENSVGHVAYFVNIHRCPEYTNCLEQQVWDEKTGLPDKQNDLDHLPDAGGYFIAKVLPIERPVSLAGKMGFAA